MDGKLKAIRAGNKAHVTRLLTKFKELEETYESDTEDVTAIETGIVQKQEALKKLNDQVIDAMSDNDNLIQEISESEEYMFELDAKLRQIRKFVQKLRQSTPVDPPVQTPLSIHAHNFTPRTQSAANSNTSALSPRDIPRERPSSLTTHENYTEQHNSSTFPSEVPVDQTSSITNSYHRLPKLDFPKFDGDVLQWTTFWDSFESAIHYNSHLTPVQKFSYLKAQLHGYAAQTIGGFTINHANYDIAVKLLQERFGSPQKIINAYMKSLNDLSSPANEFTSLRNFSDCLETYVRGLEGLGQLQEMYGAFLVPVIISKLPVEIRKNITREHDSDAITLSALRKAILKEVRVLDAGDFTEKEEFIPTSTMFAGTKKRNEKHSHPSNNRKETKSRPCIYCGDMHFPGECTKVVSSMERIEILKQKRCCFNCLGDHRATDCKSHKRCRKCNKKHHTSICKENGTQEKSRPTSINVIRTDEEPSTSTVMYTSQERTTVLLKTAIAPVTFGKQTFDTNILFDEGAQRSFISKKLADKLNIRPSGRDTIDLSTFGDTSKNVRHLETVKIYLNTDNGEKIAIQACIIPDIAKPLENQMKYVPKSLPYLRNIKFAHPLTTEGNFEIELLIGADYYWDIVMDHVIRGDGPTAVSSKIGYLLSGPVNRSRRGSTQRSSVLLNMVSSHVDVEASMEQFWSLESLGIKADEYDEEESFLKTYQQKSIKFEDGQYSAKLPWKHDHPELPSNYGIAKTRTENVIRRLSQQPQVLDKYTKIIQDQEKRGFIERVDKNDNAKSTHYIPHHAVRKDSTTTPIRIVYDCSCKLSVNHASLNDCLMSVPPDLNDLTKILMRFRLREYAISTDIEKAFLHVKLDEQDRDFTRFFWLSDPSNPNSELMTYRFKSVLFGATCSPFILHATLTKHLETHKSEISNQIQHDLYVDNILSSVNTESDAKKYYTEARTMMLEAGFNLRSWSSNSAAVRQLATAQNVLEQETTVKILGLKWNTEKDTISLNDVRFNDVNTCTNEVTKREILRLSSRIYDPLGLLSPVTVRAKILIQLLWKQKFDWDQILPTEIQQTWKELLSDLENATKIDFKRQYIPNTENENLQLHVFVDSSMTAYGATVYISDGKNTSLVIAKNRVAPLKQLTLPQLELMAALIGARLAEHVKSTLHCENVNFWSDSQIVLHWLSSSKDLKKFIRNRKQEIIELTKEHKWRYCPTKDNPADLLTRGISASQLHQSDLWFHGPTWIIDTSKWPKWNPTSATILLTSGDIAEPNTPTPHTINGIHNIVSIDRHSSLLKLLKVTAYVLRFIKNVRKPNQERNYEKFVTTDDLHEATVLWIKGVQGDFYTEEFENLKSKTEKRTAITRQLKLYLDKDDCIRCAGRIQNAPINDNAKFPYLIPPKHKFTDLLICDIHEKLKHSGVHSTVNEIRQKFWIPRIRQIVQSVLRRCTTCKKLSSQPYKTPDPPPLPKSRLQDSPPFSVTGVDFAGPFNVKDNQNMNVKAFICLFTCASTRAIHLEVVKDLSERSFLQAFRRFTSRKSRPHTMISDNALTFQAASETLKRLTDSDDVKSELSKYGIKWTFIPKRSPWYGGFWERLVGITKNCLRKTLGRNYVTLDTFETVITEIEAIVNDRPLTYLSPNIEDNEALTPSHLLYGRRINVTPYPQTEFDENSINSGKQELRKMYEMQAALIEHFWNRWRTEYLLALREFHGQSGENLQTIQIGDIVQVHDDKLPRNHWKLAKVDELIYGNDNLTRAAIIRTNTGRTSRPIVKLYPLEIRSNNTNSQEDKDDERGPSTSRGIPRRLSSIRAMEQMQKWTHK